jgi:hypothetical protein
MNPWFAAQSMHWFSYLSLLSLLSVLQVFVDRGRYRGLITTVIAAGAVLGMALVILTTVAAFAGQPDYVLLTLGVAGGVITVVFASVLLCLRHQYTAAELRRMAAKEI